MNKLRTLPIQWFDLVTFDKEWIKDKTIHYYIDTDKVKKPLVLDKDGNQVYPL